MSSFIFVQGTKEWVSLTRAFPFDAERRLTGKIAGRRLDRRFKVIDEFAPGIDAFASAIRNKRTLAPDGAQGHRDMIILSAIYQAASSGRPVVIAY